MRVLIISMTCGEGHNQIAKAIKNSLDESGATSEIMQLYGYSEKEILRQNKMFLSVCKYIPHIYNKIWLKTCEKPMKSYIGGVIKSCENYVLENINRFKPDAIVCTHNNAGAVVSHLIDAGKIDKSIKTYSIVFDYCICPYWEFNTSVDFVVLPYDDMVNGIIKKGFKKEQILSFGLPVDEKYTKEIDKQIAREQLGIEKDKFTVVLYSGGNCVSSAYKIIKKLLKCKTDIQIISVCGRNKKEFVKVERLKAKRKLKNVLNFGFCTCLDTVYSAGDVVLSRGGGMGVTEQINKHIPFILREKLITNEKINKAYFDKIGLGIAMEHLSDAPKIIDRLAKDNEKLEDMKAKAKQFCKPNATADLVKHILSK